MTTPAGWTTETWTRYQDLAWWPMCIRCGVRVLGDLAKPAAAQPTACIRCDPAQYRDRP